MKERKEVALRELEGWNILEEDRDLEEELESRKHQSLSLGLCASEEVEWR